MDQQARAEFVGAYTRILTAAWSDSAYAKKLTSDPVAALADNGLHVPAGAKVIVTRSVPDNAGEPSLDIAVGKWESGKVSGTYVLSVPDQPILATSELSEEDLMSVAAGLTISHCCCCPCCCCT